MGILAIIPARAGSKRIKNKNKKEFCGKPLVTYIIETALNSKLLTEIVVNSDDEDILSIASKYRDIRTMKRPAEISKDDSKAIDYVYQTINVLKQEGSVFDMVVILQPTSPLTSFMDIDNTIKLLKDTKADSSVSVMKLDHAIHPIKMKVMDGDTLIPFLEEEDGRMSEQELPSIFVRNCSVYVSLIKTIEKGMIIGNDCRGYVMPRERSIDINDPVDFDFAEYLYKKYL